VLWAQVWSESRQTLVHELSHRFLFHVAPGSPRWLVEGLAQYQQSMELKDGEAIVGALPDTLERFNRRIAPRSEIMAGGSEDFYPGAFALVHLLNDTPERQEKFRRYLDQLAAGVAPEVAFAELRDIDWANVDRDLPAYLPRLGWVTRRCPFHPRAVEVSAPRAVGDAELHRLWASIRPWRRQNALLVENDLTEAESLAPGAPATALLHAAHLHALGDDALALQELNPVITARPDDPAVRALHALLSLANERKQVEPRLEPVVEEIEWVAAVARTPGTLRAVAIVFAALGRGGDALSNCDAALRLTPGDDSLHELRALALHSLKRDPEAAGELQIAIALTPHDQEAQRRRRQLLLEKLR
jgi:tetratricopeptide (TPR) repeat protein